MPSAPIARSLESTAEVLFFAPSASIARAIAIESGEKNTFSTGPESARDSE